MLKQLAVFEWKYHCRQGTFVVSALLFLALGALMAQGNVGGSALHKNAPYVFSYLTCFLSLFGIFVGTFFCANVVLRDTTYKMDSLIFTTSLPRRVYFGVRWMGLLAAVFIILALGVAGAGLGTMAHDAGELGPFRVAYVLHPLLVFGLPNIFFSCSVVFSVALLTRSMRAVYMTGVGLFILYFLGSILGNSPLMAHSSPGSGTTLLPCLVDPFGITALLGETRSWPASARNSRLFPLEGAFLANRLLWMGIAAMLLLISYRYGRFHLPAGEKARRKAAPASPSRVIPYTSVAVRSKGVAYQWACFKAQWRIEVRSVFKHIPFLVMLALWVFLYAVELKENVLYGPYGLRFYASTGAIVEELSTIRPALLLLVFYAGELIHREQATHIQGLVFSTPVRNTPLWAAKCATLGVLIAVLITANIVVGIVLQLVTGFPVIDGAAYLSLYYYTGVPLFLFAVLIIFIQTLVPNKFLGMLCSLAVIGIIVFSRRLGITHLLLRYATLPGLRYSSMNGWGHYARAAHGYLLYWASLAVVLSLLATAWWKGSAHTTLWQRVRKTGRQWGPAGKMVLAVSLLVFVITGIYIAQATPQADTARFSESAMNWQVAYEKKYKGKASLPQPVIVAVNTMVDLFPADGRYTVKGHYRLRNGSGQPISILWLGVDPSVTSIRFTIPQATLQEADASFQQYFYTLARPLPPGGEMQVAFSQEVISSGFAPFNAEHAVVHNGSYIELEKYVPYLGYNDRFETGDASLRKQQGLPPLMATTSAESSYHLVDFETVVSTEADQEVVTVGTLEERWQQNNRQYFHYKTDGPINFLFALSSARYAVQKEMYRGIELSVYYHPDQPYNLPTLLQSLKDALDYGQAHFSPYQWKHLTLAGIPHYQGAATAYPGVVFSAERINFLSNLTDTTRLNPVFALTAHEVAHQWWANQLAPLDGPGRALLTESLAKYTEFMVTEKRYGKQYLRALLQADNNLYFALRNIAGEPELPLWQTNQAFGYYQKGGLAFYAIREMLGEDSLNQALRRLLSYHRYPHPKASPANLLHALKGAATSLDQVRAIDDLFTRQIVYDNKVEVVQCDPLPNGRYRLQVQVSIDKRDESGAQPGPLAPDEELTIAVYDQPMGQWTRHTRPLYQRSHQFSRQLSRVTIEVDKKPAVVVIDPYGYVLDADQGNNVQAIK